MVFLVFITRKIALNVKKTSKVYLLSLINAFKTTENESNLMHNRVLFFVRHVGRHALFR